jgi:hypothetical protein
VRSENPHFVIQWRALRMEEGGEVSVGLALHESW